MSHYRDDYEHYALVDDWERRRGVGATELNALEAQPDEFRRIVREGVEPYVDDLLDEKNKEARDQWEEEVENAIRAAVDGADLEDALDTLLKWANSYDKALEDARPVLEELCRLVNADELNEWRDTVTSAEIPRSNLPVGRARSPMTRCSTPTARMRKTLCECSSTNRASDSPNHDSALLPESLVESVR